MARGYLLNNPPLQHKFITRLSDSEEGPSLEQSELQKALANQASFLAVPSMEPYRETKKGENRSGPQGKRGKNRSELVKQSHLRSKLDLLEPNVPRNTKIAREEASKSRELADEEGCLVARLTLLILAHHHVAARHSMSQPHCCPSDLPSWPSSDSIVLWQWCWPSRRPTAPLPCAATHAVPSSFQLLCFCVSIC